MSLGRRHFLSSVSAGSAAYLAGCAPPASGPTPSADGGTPCPTPRVIEPPMLAYPPSTYFDQLSADIDAAEIGTPIVIVDLDRMEANVDAIAARLAPHTFRVVEKSLPSIELLRRVSERAGTDSFLVLHLPLLGDLLAAFPSADVIVGKTHLTSAVRRFFLDLPAGADRAAIAARVVFLADGPARLGELIALAEDADVGVTLRIAVEIDVGLRRSGLRLADGPGGLGPMLDTFLGTTSVEFAGLFGYDGHVAYSPTASAAGVLDAWRVATTAYDAFVAQLMRPEYAALVRDDLIFHSGGTSTFSLYSDPMRPTPVNDVATGGGVLRPGEYPDYFLDMLSPAIFIATPVLRRYPATDSVDEPEAPMVPFLGAAQNVAVFGGRQGLTIYGGGWPAVFTHPPIAGPPLSGPGGGCAWVPNQGLVTAAPDVPIAEGHWIYFHPTGSDVIFQFERIHLVRGGHLLPETLAAYPRRY